MSRQDYGDKPKVRWSGAVQYGELILQQQRKGVGNRKNGKNVIESEKERESPCSQCSEQGNLRGAKVIKSERLTGRKITKGCREKSRGNTEDKRIKRTGQDRRTMKGE